MAFRKLGMIEPILRSIDEHKFDKPSTIQEKAIPAAVAGKDIIAGSATGSGKTLVFGATIIQNCEKGAAIQALVMTPTRELAEQVASALKKFSRYKPLNIVSIYGGVSINPQMKDLTRADVVVGTPGRILDHISRRTIDLRYVKILVLDEADRMFDMGFIRDVEKIIHQCPKKRQTLLFSATISQDVNHIARKYMNDPMKVSGEIYVDPNKLKQKYYNVDDRMKFALLVHLLKKEHAGSVMVFCNTRQNTDFVVNNLRNNGLKAIAIHGGFTQSKRSKTMETFHGRGSQILVCTDVAARGLDIKGVSHIYNYDIPKDSKEYIHRIGRTARAGHEGKVVNILAPRDHDNFSRVLRDNGLRIPKEETPQVERVVIKTDFRREDDGRDFRQRPRFGSRQGQGRQGSRSSGPKHWGARRSGGFRR